MIGRPSNTRVWILAVLASVEERNNCDFERIICDAERDSLRTMPCCWHRSRVGWQSHWIDANRAARALKYLGEMLNSCRNASCC